MFGDETYVIPCNTTYYNVNVVVDSYWYRSIVEMKDSQLIIVGLHIALETRTAVIKSSLYLFSY